MKKPNLAAIAQIREAQQHGVDKAHAAGVRRHPEMWLEANLKAVAALWALGIDPTDPQTKLLVALVVLRSLDTAKHFYRPE